MIYCNLRGGLANIMFQIAATYAIAKDNNTNFSFPNFNNHLDYLNNDNTYNPSLKTSHNYKLLFDEKIYSNINPLPRPPYKIERFPFHYKKPENNESVLIDGFFQSEKYFIHHKNDIINLFKGDNSLHETIITKYGDSLSHKITSIHVRRGDYVNHPNHHPTQDLNYYNLAVELLDNDTDYFYIFSDDIDWCKENFKGGKYVFIEDNLDYIDLLIMGKCRNNIIANSSFSWWGAWLNCNSDKKVVAPKKWFGKAINHNTEDLIPQSWIKI